MKTEQEPTQVGSAVANLAGKHLTFRLGNESYGIPVLKVREIIRLVSITTVPQTLAHVKGVINLRGKIIPVLDLKRRLGFPTTDDTASTCIVVVQVGSPSRGLLQMGLIVDAVEEVCSISDSEIEAPPDFGTDVQTGYILGMAKLKGSVKILMDIERVVTGDIGAVPEQASAAPLAPLSVAAVSSH